LARSFLISFQWRHWDVRFVEIILEAVVILRNETGELCGEDDGGYGASHASCAADTICGKCEAGPLRDGSECFACVRSLGDSE